MELRHLRYFVAVAEELNFSRAAGRMYLSQPALSQQIRKLERELGVALFDRTKNHVALTDAGLVLLEGARKVLVMVEQTAREAREVGGAEARHLRVGFPEYANHTPVADALQTFRRRYPYVELEEHETFTLQETLQQIDKLHRGTLDVGFMLRPERDDVLEVEQGEVVLHALAEADARVHANPLPCDARRLAGEQHVEGALGVDPQHLHRSGPRGADVARGGEVVDGLGGVVLHESCVRQQDVVEGDVPAVPAETDLRTDVGQERPS